MLKLKNEDFSRDPKAVEALNNDPLIAHEVQPAITVAALVRADERLREEFPRITLPLLIMHGTEDKATICHGSEFFHETAGSKGRRAATSAPSRRTVAATDRVRAATSG